MDFGEQIKKIRAERKLTQEQMAEQLNVSRQAVSNWENNRNLPDIEMLVTMATVFHISLDQLILGGSDMNNMTEKLIRDGSEVHKARLNMISVCVGATLLLIGVMLVAIKAASVEYVDASGVLHESFFLLPIAALFFFTGFTAFAIIGVFNIVSAFSSKKRGERKGDRVFISISLGVVLLCTGIFLVLLSVNAGISTAKLGVFLMICGVGCLGASIFARIFNSGKTIEE